MTHTYDTWSYIGKLFFAAYERYAATLGMLATGKTWETLDVKCQRAVTAAVREVLEPNLKLYQSQAEQSRAQTKRLTINNANLKIELAKLEGKLAAARSERDRLHQANSELAARLDAHKEAIEFFTRRNSRV